MSKKRWITLRNGRRAQIDERGHEIRRGGREILRDPRGHSLSPRYPRKEVAIEALLRDNPRLHEFVEENWGSDSQAYRSWLANRQRGPKPQLAPGDGRFDPINVAHDLRGPRRCSSFLEALYVTVPSTYRWEDITPDRLWPLEECVGFQVSPPAESTRLPLAREETRECKTKKKEIHEALLHRATTGRLPPRDVPF
jgi:hypothetical protein